MDTFSNSNDPFNILLVSSYDLTGHANFPQIFIRKLCARTLIVPHGPSSSKFVIEVILRML